MKKTALYPWHEKAGARIIDFGGWLMPVQYSGIIAEHKAVRSGAGLFDVSHMGNFSVRGPRALEFLQYMTTNDLGRAVDGQAQYTVMLYPDGGIVDDLIIYRIDSETFFIIVNAGNCEKDYQWFREHVGAFDGVELEDRSQELSLIALQGPKAFGVLRKALPAVDAETLGSFHFRKAEFRGAEIVVARTGYTGEVGVEIAVPNAMAVPLWEALLEAGKEEGILPIGLGARDTLRLEMGYSLYGHEIDRDTNPLEARLKWVVKLDKGEFIGRDACLKVDADPKRSVAGFALDGRALPRQGCPVFSAGGEEIGRVCSGTLSPTLQEPVGTCSVLREYAKVGTPLFVEIRGVRQPGSIRRLPFVKTSLS
ncbi:glycine cleavage system aminomethyltransferase GcvT [Chlorobium sp. N1]|uniref:glycine cleavage system aminomethyltransferase GcvT n=1 Tax=Chlorobium sp. N1 TaxID=2491138 RepID=UPI00103BE333|nr:glycine cleavage system aminomethyltransferase GcvT [Chlorobium sp. N1]TCD47569.1 glycine cleavage system aminomethyltransferase GcvT [Chlorobium sp. N1]